MQVVQAGVVWFVTNASSCCRYIKNPQIAEGHRMRQSELQGNQEGPLDGKLQYRMDILSLYSAYYFLTYCFQGGWRHS